jgi:ssDNA thymidine ADP-ribosyltransferase DarT-like protein
VGEPVSDLEAIQSDVLQRGITRLCHFTRSEKLAHMLAQTQAILPTQELRERYPDLLDVTDTQRLDGRLAYICCSIAYPNTWYLRTIKAHNTPFQDWIILCLDPCLLWERIALFSPRNAAAQRGALLRGGWQGWSALFHPEVQGAGGVVRRRTPRHLRCCPTDDQAEVLIPGAVSKSYIRMVIVADAMQAHREQVRYRVLGIEADFEWRIAPALFTSAWSGAVRQGQRPQEQLP